MLTRPLRALLTALIVLPLALTSANAEPRVEGALVIDGVPAIPPELVERSAQYANTRAASFAGFTPKSGGILISTRFGETQQIHQVNSPGGVRRQLTFQRESVASGGFAPDGDETELLYAMDQGGGEFGQFYLQDLRTGKSTLLTDGRSKNESASFSHKGGRLAFVSTERNRRDFDIWLYEPGKGRRMLKERQGQWSVMDWSPDDRRLLLRNEVSVVSSSLHILDIETGEITPVRPLDTNVSYGGAAFTPDGSGVITTSDEASDLKQLVRIDADGRRTVLVTGGAYDVEGFTLSRDGRWLMTTTNEGGRSAVYLAPYSKPQKAHRLDVPVGVLLGYRFDPESRRLALNLSTAETPADVFMADVRTRKIERWTTSEVGGLDPSTFVEPTLVSTKSFDGLEVPAWYYRPRTGSKHPVVIQIHGGPESQSRPTFSSTVQQWVNELGIAVLTPNVRGSSGYGKAYVAMDDGMKRLDSVKDIGAVLDWVAKQPELDASRVAVYGGSYGGFMVLSSLIHYGDRLRCGVDSVGISNFVTFLENTEDYRKDLRRVEYGDERIPEMRSFLLEASPMTHASKLTRPLFVVQGKNDPRVPYTEAEQIVASVRQNNSPVWYLLANDEGHGFRRRSNREYLQNATTLFWQDYLLK